MLAQPGCHAGDLVFLCQRLALPPQGFSGGSTLARTTTPEANTGQWVILVTLEAESSEVTMTGQKPGLPERVLGGGLGRSEKSPGGRQADAEVRVWREAGTGYPPYYPPPRVSRL